MGDPEVYRTKEEVAEARNREPIARLGERFKTMGVDENDVKAFGGPRRRNYCRRARICRSQPHCPEEAFDDIFA